MNYSVLPWLSFRLTCLEHTFLYAFHSDNFFLLRIRFFKLTYLEYIYPMVIILFKISFNPIFFSLYKYRKFFKKFNSYFNFNIGVITYFLNPNFVGRGIRRVRLKIQF